MASINIAVMAKVSHEINEERFRQEDLQSQGRFAHTCADPDVDEGYKLGVLVEEIGEVGRALMEKMGKIGDRHNKDLRKELIQVAAVAQAWAEALSV